MDGRRESKSFWRMARLLAWTLLVATLIRSLLVATFIIPSQSMMPRLLTGDIFIATKWSYGYSRYSFSSNLPLFEGRIMGSTPKIGDVVILAGPVDHSVTFIKRVMGLPGDTVEMRDGLFYLNGRRLPQTPRSEFVIPLGPNVICLAIPGLIDLRSLTADAKPGCKFLQARERLPSGRMHRVLDFAIARSDTFGPQKVPAGHLFMMGDNRDDSLDSRFPITSGGLGMVPLQNVIGKARWVVFSSDGTGSVLKPWTWQSAIRPSQTGPIN
jgi:signal peptidase I